MVTRVAMWDPSVASTAWYTMSCERNKWAGRARRAASSCHARRAGASCACSCARACAARRASCEACESGATTCGDPGTTRGGQSQLGQVCNMW